MTIKPVDMKRLHHALRVARATDPEMHAASQKLVGAAVVVFAAGVVGGVCLAECVRWLWGWW